MMQRYDLVGHDGEMELSADGDYISHEDHMKAMEAVIIAMLNLINELEVQLIGEDE